MSVLVSDTSSSRTSRMSVLVSGAEAAEIARLADQAGLSVSAYLRDRALGNDDDAASATALRQVDTLIEHMSSDVDRAISVLNETLERLNQA